MGLRSRFAGTAAISVIPVAIGSAGPEVVTTGIATAISMFWILASVRVDMMWRQLPDALVVLAVLPTAMAVAVLSMEGSPTAVAGVGYGAVASALPLLLAHVSRPAALGFGDVKVAGVLGAIAGLTQPIVFVALGLVVALAAATVSGLATRRSEISLGPFLAGGACSSLLVGHLLGHTS